MTSLRQHLEIKCEKDAFTFLPHRVKKIKNVPLLQFLDIYKDLLDEVSIQNLIILAFDIFHTILVPCLPCVAVEGTAAEVDKIKLIIANKMTTTLDCNEKLEFRLFLRYLIHRPFRFLVWRVVPVDADLPVSVVSICTTYLIVLVQLTHLFE
ncbi:hypothetical protein EVAR_48565_1 [Eumeta japonica]|uniref:Uncharacterized protein n=1 Tax=Eumeta variegata TaxID=151549 RepID=A0A4C1XB61_EUMVA|nr:hypothetical protein EVAR_48565_1 [Eumeta japonica]